MKHKNILFLSLLFFYSLQANPTLILDATIPGTSENTTALSDQASPQFSEKKRIVTRFDLANKEMKAKASNDLNSILNQIEELRLAEKKFSTYAKIGAACLGTYFYCAAATLAHELGHALTAKALTGSPIHIALGGTNPSPTAPITINSFNPLNGGACGIMFLKTPMELMAILAAGPLAGIAFNIAFLKIINIIDEYKKNNSVTHAIKKGLTKPSFSDKHHLINLLCFISIYNNLFNLLPISTNDGFYMSLCIPKGSIAMSLTHLLGAIYTIKKYASSRFIKENIVNICDYFTDDDLKPIKGLRELL